MTTTVLIVDDQAETRSALRTIVEQQAGMRVVGEAVDGLDALGQAQRRRPDIVLMDIRMPRMDGLTATRRLRQNPRGPAVVVLTTFDEDANVFDALQAGAAGFLLKTASVERIADALHAVADGGGLIAPDVTRRLIDRFAAVSPARPRDPSLDALTVRERDVLKLIADGLTNAQIADELVLEESTVKSHVGRLLTKLGVASRVQAVIYAYETGVTTAGRSHRPAD